MERSHYRMADMDSDKLLSASDLADGFNQKETLEKLKEKLRRYAKERLVDFGQLIIEASSR